MVLTNPVNSSIINIEKQKERYKMTINLEDIKKITELEDAGYEVETVLDLYITVYKGNEVVFQGEVEDFHLTF